MIEISNKLLQAVETTDATVQRALCTLRARVIPIAGLLQPVKHNINIARRKILSNNLLYSDISQNQSRYFKHSYKQRTNSH